jgi:putative two-component system hydrogenase maturation factor HypX/HoxX
MRILLLTHAFDDLGQRLYVDLVEDGHDVTVEVDSADAAIREAVARVRPEVVVVPLLKRRIPASVFLFVPCLIVHPGPPGDRGPSPLDWAILDGAETWGVTILQAEDEMDAGDIWACEAFALRAAAKSSLYRREVTEAASRALRRALSRLDSRSPAPAPRLDPRPLCRQADRAIDWATDDTATVLRKIRSADGSPGLRDSLFGVTAWLADASPAEGLSGPAGTAIARCCGGAIAKATVDGAVWIGRARRQSPPGAAPAVLRPATLAFAEAAGALPEAPGPQAIRYEERGAVGILQFAFHDGVLTAEDCDALRHAVQTAAARPTRVLLLMGGPDVWSDGLDRQVIEAAADPAEADRRAAAALAGLVEAISSAAQVTVAGLQGNARAAGARLALAADHVWARRGSLLVPQEAATETLPAAGLPLGADQAAALGLVGRVFADEPGHFPAAVLAAAAELAAAAD